MAAQLATADWEGCRNAEVGGNVISRLTFEPFAPEESCNYCPVVAISWAVGEIPCVRADGPRVGFCFRHSVVLGKLLSASEPQFPHL